MLKVYLYIAYLFLSISMTVWVARTLHSRGRVFLIDAFGENEELADSINHLLVVGFYLLNLGYVALRMKVGSAPELPHEVLELLASQMGAILLGTGAFHLFNVFVFSRFAAGRKKHKTSRLRTQDLNA